MIGNMKHNMQKSYKYSLLNRSLLIVIFIHCIFFSGMAVFGQNATINEENIAIRTYPFSDPSPIPSIAMNSQLSLF